SGPRGRQLWDCAGESSWRQASRGCSILAIVARETISTLGKMRRYLSPLAGQSYPAWLSIASLAAHAKAAKALSPPPPARARAACDVHSGTFSIMQISKSNKLANVCYDIRGPVLKHAKRLEDEGHRVLKLNIGNPAPFGFEAPEEILQDV